jgi:hypothetical protein
MPSSSFRFSVSLFLLLPVFTALTCDPCHGAADVPVELVHLLPPDADGVGVEELRVVVCLKERGERVFLVERSMVDRWPFVFSFLFFAPPLLFPSLSAPHFLFLYTLVPSSRCPLDIADIERKEEKEPGDPSFSSPWK